MRDAKKWGKKLLFLRSPKELGNVSLDGDCICTIKFKKCFLDLMISNQSSDTTVIFFHAALSKRGDLKLPVFSGARLGAGLGVNKIFISDPSLYLSNTLRLGWFLGSKYLSGKEDIAYSLLEVLRVLGTKRVILFGASAGGFASILYGGMLKKYCGLDVLSVAVNPQTNILKFSKGPVREYFRTCWGVDSNDFYKLDDLNLSYDLLGSLESPGNLPLLYIQNTGDHHYQDHFLPFLKYCNDASFSNHKFVLSDWFGEGHVSPPLGYLKSVLSSVLEPSLDLSDLPGVCKFENYFN